MTRRTLAAALAALGALAATAAAPAATPDDSPPPDGALAGAPAPEAARPAFRAETAVLRSFGETSYEMNALAPDPRDPERLVPIRSRLEFPLDATLLEVRLSWQPGGGTLERWSLSAGYRFDLDDPSGTLTDGDFFDGRQISLAESEPTWDLRLADAEVRWRLHGGERTRAAALLHLDYERIEQHAVGFVGWRSGLFSDFRVPVSGTYPVVDYRVTYWSPRLGGAFDWRAARRAEIGLQGSAGFVFASDVDDHLARRRIAEGDGTGVGVHSRLGFGLSPGFLAWVPRLSADLAGEMRYFRAQGKVTQRFYDENGEWTGEENRGLTHDLESLQFAVSLGVGFRI